MTRLDLWEPERVNLACSLYMAGHSAAQIALTLGRGVSRNAVIGKLHRLKITRSPEVNRTNMAHPRMVLAISSSPRRPRRGHASTKRPIVAPKPLAAVLDDPGATTGHPVTLLALTHRSCRWPVSGDGADTMFCGQPKAKGSFCAHHAAIAWTSKPEPFDHKRKRAAA